MRNRERVLRSGGRLSTWLLKRDSAASCHLNGSFAETTHQTMSPRPLLSCSCWPLRPSSCLHTFLLRTSTLSLVGPAQRARLLMMMPCTAELSGTQSPQFMVSLHRMREIRFLASRRRVCVASRYRSAAATPVQWPCLVPRLPECGLAVVGGGMATANKADMSWLLNRTDESGSHGQGPVDARASGTSSQWNEQAPMLYRLAAHASSSDLAGGIGAILTDADHAGPTTNTSPARPHQGSGTHPHPLRLHQAEQPREPLCRTSSPDSQGSNDTVLAGKGTKQEGDENRRKSCAIALDESLAIQIYASRPRNAGSKYGSMAAAVRLGERHGVSPKTIRDIWNRKSWVKVTRAYWTAAEESAYVPRRHRASSPQGSRTGSSKRCGRGRESKAG